MPPVAAFVGGIVSALNFAATAAIAGIQSAFIGAGLGAGFVSGLTGVLGKVALSLGFSYLSSLLRPRADVPTPGARMVNQRQGIRNMTKSYGLVRPGAVVYFWQAKNGKRYVGLVFNVGRIHAIVSRYLDEREVSLSEMGFVTDAKYQAGGRSRIQIQEFLGAPDQLSPSLLLANFSEWTDAHKLTGCPHAVMACENAGSEFFSTIYPTGREPIYTPLIESSLVFDPRDPAQSIDDPETYGYTTNAALIIADWICSPEGLGRDVDWDDVAIEADASDVIVIDRNLNSVPKWQLCGTFDLTMERETVRAQLAIACDAFFFERADGKVGFKVGRYEEPTVTLDATTIIGGTITEGADGTTAVNAFSIQYTEAATGYREFQSAAYTIETDEAYQEDTLQAFWVPNHNQAIRVSKRLLRVTRAQYRANLQLNLEGMRLIGGKRFFRVRLDDFGVDVAFEVDRLILADNGLTLDLEASSVTPADFNFDAATEEPQRPALTIIDDDTAVTAPIDVALTSETVNVSGSLAAVLRFDWTQDRDTYFSKIRYRLLGTTGWFEVDVPQGQDYQRVAGISDGASYEGQVRSQTSTGQVSAWAPVTPLVVNVVADTTPPTDLADFEVTGGSGRASIAFTTPNDDHVRKVDLFRVAAGGAFDPSTATPMERVAVVPSGSYSYVDGDPAPVNAVVNGTFAADTDWAKEGGWSIGSGVASRTATGSVSSILQTTSLTAGLVYRIKYDVVTITAGDIRARLLGSAASDGPGETTTGQKLTTLTAPAAPTRLGFRASAPFAGSIDNVVMYQQTIDSAPQGVWDYYAVPRNGSNVPGPTSGPVTVTII